MEEIDNIIIDSLRNLHCEIDESISSLKQFDGDLLFTAITTCLQSIVPSSNFPKYLPASMSVKLQVASNIASQIKDLGFREEIGYQTILYYNESEIRRVFMFLIERLPREASETTQIEHIGYVPKLVKEIEEKIRDSMHQLWLPSAILNKGYRRVKSGYFLGTTGDSGVLVSKKLQIPDTEHNSDEALKQYWIRNVPIVTKQCSQKELIPSLLFNDCVINTSNIEKILARKQEAFPILLRSESVESETPEINTQNIAQHSKPDKLQTLLNRLKIQKENYLELQQLLNNSQNQLDETTTMRNDEKTLLNNTLSKINVTTKTLTVLSKEDSVLKLKNLIENNNNKLIHLTDQWNQIQTPLLEEYKSLQNSASSEDLKAQEELNKLKKVRETHESLNSDLVEKAQLEEQLKLKLQQTSKNHNRSGYTRRILEIIGNVQKQDNEIGKILIDTKEIQREIKALTGQIDRSFTLSEELIFRDAKQDEIARRAYKLLAQLREDCSNINKAVTELGLVERESRNLRDQIDTETAKDSTAKLERVTKDLLEIRKETEMLLKQT